MNWLDYVSVMLLFALLIQHTLLSNRIEAELKAYYDPEFLEYLRRRD